MVLDVTVCGWMPVYLSGHGEIDPRLMKVLIVTRHYRVTTASAVAGTGQAMLIFKPTATLLDLSFKLAISILFSRPSLSWNFGEAHNLLTEIDHGCKILSYRRKGCTVGREANSVLR
jgi:hypothetical protein